MLDMIIPDHCRRVAVTQRSTHPDDAMGIYEAIYMYYNRIEGLEQTCNHITDVVSLLPSQTD